MKKIKNILQFLLAFILALSAYNIFYLPYQESVRAVVRANLPVNLQQTASIGGTDAVVSGAEKLTIKVLDVGQADAILLADGKRNVLIDVGDSKQDKMGAGGRKALEAQLAKAGVGKVQTVFVTHHHADHMGNIKWVPGKYAVKNIYDNGMANSASPTSQWLDKELRAGHYHGRALKAGEVVKFDENYYVEVLAPGDFLDKQALKSFNNTSLVLKLHYGDFSMLLTGDAEAEVEDALQRKYGSKLKADVLKVGHHGSRTSSIYAFITKVKPSYALISCGEQSIYHHPNAQVVGRLQHFGAKVLTTHEHGTLTVVTDGKSFNVTTAK